MKSIFRILIGKKIKKYHFYLRKLEKYHLYFKKNILIILSLITAKVVQQVYIV